MVIIPLVLTLPGLQRNISQPACVSKWRTYDEKYTQPNDDSRT